jgi:hypothetical protein
MPSIVWYLSQLVGIVGTLGAVVAGSIAAYKAIIELKRARLQRADELDQRKEALEQRKQEFRQKQAMFARDIIKDIQADKRASDALMMLDFGEYDYTDAEKNKTHHIKRGEIQRVLLSQEIPEEERDPDKETFIRKSFERLYDHLEQVQNLLDVGVLNLADLETTLRYYMRIALEPDIEHMWFFDEFEYPGVKRFMKTLGSGPADRI